MSKTYISTTIHRSPRPRSGRAATGASVSSTVTIHGGGSATSPQPPTTVETHSHPNKTDLDKLSADPAGYLLISGNKTKAGHADTATEATHAAEAAHAAEADHAALAHDLDPDSPANERFLSAQADDTAEGRITLAKGAQFGSFFAPGDAGGGGEIDDVGNAELNSLRLRRFLEVPELRFNRVEVIAGTQWRSKGGGIVKAVIAGMNAMTLKLEKGEFPAVQKGDLCMGIWHYGDERDATETKDDGRGGFSFKGFTTVYFVVDQVVPNLGEVKYTLRNGCKAHPANEMHFVVICNPSDPTRQTCRYSTPEYERYLENLTTWEFQMENIAAQFGDLSNLSIFGLKLEGYSVYLKNIYMTGRITKLDAPARIEVKSESGTTLVDRTVALFLRGEVTIEGIPVATDLTWTIRRESGDEAADNAWNASQPTNQTGRFRVTWADLGAEGLYKPILFTLQAVGET